MAAQHNFKKFKIWKEGIDIVKDTYVTTKNFTKTEIYSLTKQLQHCSISILSNIAEGTSKSTAKHFITYLDIAQGKAFEWVTQLIIAFQIHYISKDTFKHL